MKKKLYLATALLVAFACSREPITPEDPVNPEVPGAVTGDPIKVTLVSGNPGTRTFVHSVADTENNNQLVLRPFWSSTDGLSVIRVPDNLQYFPLVSNDWGSYYSCPWADFTIDLQGGDGSTAYFDGQVGAAGQYRAYYPPTREVEIHGEEEVVWTEVLGPRPYVYVDDTSLYSSIDFTIPTVQSPTKTSFDPSADFLVSEPFTIDGTEASDIQVSFTRLNAIVKVAFQDMTGGLLKDERIRKVTLGDYYPGGEKHSAPPSTRASIEDNDEYDRGLTGDVYYYFDADGSSEYVIDTYSSGVVAQYTDETAYKIGEKIGDDEAATYLIVAPCILKNDVWVWGDEENIDGLRIQVETDNYIIERNVTLPAAGVALQPSRVTTLNIGLYGDGVKETFILEKGISFYHWEEYNDVQVTSLSVKEDTYEELRIDLVGLTLDGDEDAWKSELEVSCEPSDYVRVDLENAYYDYSSGSIFNVRVWGNKATETGSPATVTFSAGDFSSDLLVNVQETNSPASIVLDDDVSDLNVDQFYAPEPLTATIIPKDEEQDLEANSDLFACKLVNGGEIENVVFWVYGNQMTITFPVFDEAGEYEIMFTYKDEPLLTEPISLTVWEAAELPAWSNPSWWFGQYMNTNGGLKTYAASKVRNGDVPSRAFWGVNGDFDAFRCFTGLTEVPEKAFYSCEGLTGITLPEDITVIGANAFSGCSNLEGISLPERLSTIVDGAFYGSGITSIAIPGSVTEMGASVFSHCSNLSEVSFLEGFSLNEIPQGTFYHTSNLKSITIPASVLSIGIDAFYAYSDGGLESVEFLGNVTTIGDGAFATCPLVSIEFPESLTTIGNNAFEDCLFTSVEIPGGVTSIGQYAFYQCPLENVYLHPTAVPSIGYGAFGLINYAHYPIYVPDGSYTDYHTAAGNGFGTDYSFDADRIKKMSEAPTP